MNNLMRKQFLPFARRYKLFSLALMASLVGLGLQLAGYTTATNWLLAGAALLIAVPLLRGMWEDFHAGSYGIDILALTAIVTAVLLKEYWAAMVVVLMLTGGEALEDYAEHRSKTELDALLRRAPQAAHVLRGKKVVDVPATLVKVGERIIIKPGETVPVDAQVIEGSSSFDESSLTGESIPVAKDPGAMLLSGSINNEGAVTAKATQTAANSQYQQIVKLVRSAANSQAPFVRLADRYSVPFTIFAFLLAGGVWIASGDPKRFLEVIIVATPCPLILAAPIAIISGMSRSAKQGIIVRTGKALERLAQVKTIAFDKTGTLTEGRPVVADILTYGKLTKQEVLSYAAAVEASSTHVLAHAINEAALEQKLKIPKVRQVSESSGQGLSAVVSGKRVLVGRMSFMHKHDIEVSKSFKAGAIKQTATFVAVDGQLAGALTFKDEIRPESQATLKRLQRLGIRRFLMVTGDNQTAAAAVAKKLGIDDVTAEALPAAKLRAVEAVKDRPVAFVGDGVNDAPVLTAADVGIALGARGSTAASESADIIIMADDVSRVASALEISRRTFRIAKQSIFVGIGLSVLLMLVFATGRFEPIHGAAIQELVDVIVIFNALRAHSGGR
ncbi:MAG TPA: heavy metal translocating P-type ATPase [Candidatus Saccharimonadales bacterium]|nr:heavy metal translocating P-type ATPase [Candidatus Saccharimonadales bacterium]